MYRARSRQIARLDKLAEPYIAEKSSSGGRRWDDIRYGAVLHATVLAFLIRHGEPRLGEPLSEACERVTESKAWEDFRDRFFPTAKPLPPKSRVRRGRPFELYTRDKVLIIGSPLRHVVISSFPGVDEKAKLNAVFKSAPPWLVWFTFADYTAAVLGLDLPDLSNVTCFARSREVFDNWWGLPDEAFESRPWPKFFVKNPLCRTDLSLLRSESENSEFRSRRERVATSVEASNTDQWPVLIPEEFFLQDDDSMSPFEETKEFEERKHPLFYGKF